MEFGNELVHALRQRFRGDAGACPAPAMDWQGLRARLAAAHAARGELLGRNAANAALSGSFAPAAAAGLAASNAGTLLVNPYDLGDRKSCAGIDLQVAGAGVSGDARV